MTGARTTTFLFTDLVGSTDILDRVGDDAAASLQRVHFGLLRDVVNKYGGHEVKNLGDGLMVTFASALEGVAAAVSAQVAIAAYNHTGNGPRLQVRIGLHTGEPIHGDDDYFGSAVVIASRLCDCAAPEQIIASSLVRNLVGRRGGFPFVSLGNLTLKGFAEPVEAFSIDWLSAPEEPLASQTALAQGSPEVNGSKTRVLVVEDEALWADLLSQRLAEERGIEVVGVAKDGETAVRMADVLHADVVVMDIELGAGLDGIEAALQIKEVRPATGIVLLSAHVDRRYVTSLPLVEKPGWSYLTKQGTQDVASVVRAIEASLTALPMVDAAVLEGLRPRPRSKLARLTKREWEVLELVTQAFNNAAIAERLVVTERAVEAHINAIYDKLDVSGEPGMNARVQAVLIYLEESGSQE